MSDGEERSSFLMIFMLLLKKKADTATHIEPLAPRVLEHIGSLRQGQTAVEVTVTQGEDTAVEYVNKIATHKFELPEDRPPECPIKVTYSYDVNQRMHCKFEDVESGRTLEVALGLNNKGQMLEEEVKKEESKLSGMKIS